MPKKKSKLKWTKKLPTVDGFYWWRNSQWDKEPERMVIYGGVVAGTERLFDVKNNVFIASQWYGPIPSKEPK